MVVRVAFVSFVCLVFLALLGVGDDLRHLDSERAVVGQRRLGSLRIDGGTLEGSADLPEGAAVDPEGAEATLTDNGTLRVEVPKVVADPEESEEHEADEDHEGDADDDEA